MTDPEQIKRDFHREYYSERSGYHTLHIQNTSIDHHLEEISDAIAKVVDREKLPNQIHDDLKKIISLE